MEEKRIVYMVQLDWSTDDDSGNDIYLFSSYDKAKDKFLELIEHEKDPNCSWVYQAFKDNSELDERYELETNIDYDKSYELFWDITDTYDYCFRTHIQLREMEIKL